MDTFQQFGAMFFGRLRKCIKICLYFTVAISFCRGLDRGHTLVQVSIREWWDLQSVRGYAAHFRDTAKQSHGKIA